MRISKRAKILFISISAPLLFALAFVLVIVFYLNFHKLPEVDVLTNGFMPHTIEITEGETIHFVNRSATLTQTLCLGVDKRCDPLALLPRGLKSPGVQIAPDQAKDILFDTYGTFYITSTTVPGVNITITVDAAD